MVTTTMQVSLGRALMSSIIQICWQQYNTLKIMSRSTEAASVVRNSRQEMENDSSVLNGSDNYNIRTSACSIQFIPHVRPNFVAGEHHGIT